MENYCTSCGKWSWLVAFWLCRDCSNRFYGRAGAGVNDEGVSVDLSC